MEGLEGGVGQRVRGVASRVIQYAKNATEFRPSELAFENINSGHIATIIYEHIIGGPHMRIASRRWNNPITAELVFRNARIKPNPEHPVSKNREVIMRRIEVCLKNLADQGVLKDVTTDREERPLGGSYIVSNPEILQEIAKGKLPTSPEAA